MIHFLSYPKSGRTWIRFMLNEYLRCQHALEVTNVFGVEQVMGADYPLNWTHLTSAMLMDLPYDKMGAIDYTQFDGQRFILLTRDFRATMASAYRHAVHRINRWTGSPSDFLRSDVYGVIKLVTLMNMWERIRPRLADEHTLSYEAALADPEPTLRVCLELAGIPPDDQLLGSAIEAGSYENMKRTSTRPEYTGTPLAPSDPGNPDSFKVRSGGRSDWRDLFTIEDAQWIESLANNLLTHPRPDYFGATPDCETVSASLVQA